MAEIRARIVEVVDVWYRAAFGEFPTSEPLRAMTALLGGAGAACFDLDRGSGRIGQFHIHQLEQGAGEYVERMNRINPRMIHSLTHPAPHIVTDYQILSEPALRKNEFYHWMERTNGTRYFVGARILDDGTDSLFASVEFGPRQGHATEEKVDAFRRVIPHIANAWRISGLLRSVDRAGRVTQLLAAQSRCGIVGLRDDGRILFANPAAESALALGDGLAVIEGRLHATRAASDRALQATVTRVLRPEPEELSDPGGAVAASRPSGRIPFVLRVLNCGRLDPHAGDPLPAALVLIANPDQNAVLRDGTLRALGLSPAEIRLARHLARGRTLADAARELELSHNTARAHLRSIFAKTQARSQVELVRMLCEFAWLDGA